MPPPGRERLSVVVPTWNEEPCVARALESLAAHGADSPEEVLVVDGGSADGTPRIAEEHGARVLRSARGRGVQLARGAREASGDLLLFMHADARLLRGTLGAVRRAFGDPGLLAAGLHQRIAGRGLLYRVIERAADARVRRGWIYGDSTLVVRRSAYEAAGGFRDQPLFEDLDLARRLRRQGRTGIVRGGAVEISARRWERDGVLARSAKNWALTLAWLAGVEPARLARYYPAEGGVPGEP
jgi:rSAM/selenodomain-associated transferase 2